VRDLFLIAAVALVSFGLRASFIALATGRALPVRVERVIGQLRPSAFAALATTAVVSHGGAAAPHLLAVIAVGWVARRGSLLAAFAVGFVVLLSGIHLL
jgi:branched-subunit amino acid transport protein